MFLLWIPEIISTAYYMELIGYGGNVAICIRKVPGSELDRNDSYPDWNMAELLQHGVCK